MKKLLLAIVLLGGFSIHGSAIDAQMSSKAPLKKAGAKQLALFFFVMGLENKTKEIVEITQEMLSEKKLRIVTFVLLEYFRIGLAARSLCDKQDENIYRRYVDYLNKILLDAEKSAALFHAFRDAVPKKVRNNTIYYFDQDYAQLRLDCINKELAKQTAFLK